MASERAILEAIAGMDPRALERVTGKASGTLVASGLDPKTYTLVRLAALIAIDGSPASFVWEVGDARRHGASDKDLFGLLVAIASTVGSPRIVAAAAEISFALTDADLSRRRDRGAVDGPGEEG